MHVCIRRKKKECKRKTAIKSKILLRTYKDEMNGKPI